VAAASRWLDPARRFARSLGSGRRELAIALGAYGLYSLVRGVFGGTLEEGVANAASLVDLERRLGIFVEPDIQRFFVDNHLAMPFWNFFYPASQVVVLPLTLFLVYRHRREAYPPVRDMAILSWCAGLVWYALQPTAPPRLAGYAEDTVTRQTFFDLDHGFIEAFYNPVAAMPSLHVGMAPVVAWALWRLTSRWWTRALGILYPLLVATSIVVTGNHYLLDIAGGLAVVLPAAGIAWALTRPGRSPATRDVPAAGPARPYAPAAPSEPARRSSIR
jgi:membrane-associated phospholipid phosphatase